MKKQSFKETVSDMKLSDIILAMVNGIEKQWVNLSMGTFGENSDGVCYGCAATNTICEIVQKSFPPDKIDYRSDRALWLKTDKEFLQSFESFIDDLRRGKTTPFHHITIIWYERIYGKPLPDVFLNLDLPYLTNTTTTKENLNLYRKAAMILKENNL